MKIVTKYETNDEILIIFSIEKEPLKYPLAVEDVKLENLSDEQIICFLKEQIKEL